MPSNINHKEIGIELVLFDFGGVLSEEGFREGLMAIASLNRHDPQVFYKKVVDIIFKTGYLTGQSNENTLWQTLRKQFGIQGSDENLRNEILSRFKLRKWMIALVKGLKKMHVHSAILSDQTNWLDELDVRYDFYKYFDKIFNSYHMKKSKRDSTVFDDVLSLMGVIPHKALFVDDTIDHIKRARQKRLNTIFYRDRETFEQSFAHYFPTLK